jgi:phage terminase large subunit GpA-like protein
MQILQQGKPANEILFNQQCPCCNSVIQFSLAEATKTFEGPANTIPVLSVQCPACNETIRRER